MTNRITLEPAYILHRRPYSNTSYIIDFFTRAHGRVSAIARSARGPKSRYRGKLELFVPMLVSWTGKFELKNLGSVEFYQPPLNLQGDALLCAFYLNELLEKCLHREDAHTQLFDVYEKTLPLLMQKEKRETGLRLFEKTLLQELGYGVDWVRDVESGEPIQTDKSYEYYHERGFIKVSAHSEETLQVSGATLLALKNETFTTALQLQEAKHLMRVFLRYLLDGKKLHSRALF